MVFRIHRGEVTVIRSRLLPTILAILLGAIALGYLTLWWVPIVVLMVLAVWGLNWIKKNVVRLSTGGPSDPI